MSKLAMRIVRTLHADHGIEWPGGAANAAIGRTYAGRHQRAAGAWSWALERRDGKHFLGCPSIGSQYPASEIARGFEVFETSVGDIDLSPKRG